MEGSRVAYGSGEAEILADSMVRLGKARAKLPAPGRGTLQLSLLGKGEADKTNSYEFFVRGGRAPRRGPLALGR